MDRNEARRDPSTHPDVRSVVRGSTGKNRRGSRGIVDGFVDGTGRDQGRGGEDEQNSGKGDEHGGKVCSFTRFFAGREANTVWGLKWGETSELPSLVGPFMPNNLFATASDARWI
jgi:hypothetical protein